MKILDRYIGTTVSYHTFIVMAVIMSLFMFSYFINELDDIGKGNYDASQAMLYVLLTLPRLAYQLFPTVALLGSIIGLGVLASNSELISIRAAGVSISRIIMSVMKAGIVLMLLAAFLGEVVAPESERFAKNIRSSAMTGEVALKTASGFWARDGDRFVKIGEMFSDGTLGEITIYEMDEQRRLKIITHAKRAFYKGDKWVLMDIERSTLNKDEIQTEQLPNADWESLLNPDLLGVVTVDPEFLPTWGLYKYYKYLQENGLNSARYEQAFWSKIATPLITGVMVFIAIPFVLGPLRSVAIGQRIVIGTMAGIGFYAINQLANYFGLVFQFNPVLSVMLPPVSFLILAVFLMRRIH